MFRITLVFFLLSTRLFAQRDTIINGAKLHLLSAEHSDTIATAWITNVSTSTGAYYEIYPNGKIKTKGNMNAGVKAGTWETYFPGGQLQSHGMYQKGKREGAWKYYYADGKTYCSGYFTKDERDGLWRMWFANDSLMSRGQYWHGCCTGTWKWYYDNGKLKAWAHYRAKSKLKRTEKVIGKNNGVEHTKHYAWLMRKYVFFNVDSLVEYYPDGKLRSHILYDKEGLRSDTARFWFENGQLNHEEYYKQIDPAGCWIYYCEDGSVHSLADYGNGTTCNSNKNASSNCTYSGDIMPLIQYDFIYYPVQAKF